MCLREAGLLRALYGFGKDGGYVEERFVFSGPLGVFDGYGDYAIVLNYLRDRRNNLGFGIFFLILFGMGLLVLIPGGSMGEIVSAGIICLLILANQYAVASGYFTMRQLRQRNKDREKYIDAGKYFAKDLNMADPITLTFADGECRMRCGKLDERTPYRRIRTVSECGEVFHITGYKMVDIVVPKSFLQEGSMEGFRALLRQQSKRWHDFAVPEKFETYIRENRFY